MKNFTIIKTRKVALLLGISIVLSVQSFATNVSGLISTNTTWTKANSPYVVTNNILVNSGVTLTIQPGVTVKFNALKSIQIDGTLIAKGTNADSIRFTSNTTQTAGAWGYIYFSDASIDAVFENDINRKYLSGSILEYCKVEYAGGASVENNGALKLDSAHPFVNHCTISNNSSRGIMAFNLNGQLKITNSLISHNTLIIENNEYGGGMKIVGNGRNTLISGNTITYNTATIGGGIFLSNLTDGAIITNNIISHNTANSGGGLGCWGNATIMYNVILYNTALNWDGGGIYATNGDGIVDDIGTITGNLVINNSAPIFSGLYIQWIPLSHNIIAENASTEGAGTVEFYERTISYNQIVNNSAITDVGIYSEVFDNTGEILSNTIAYNKSSDLMNNSSVINITGYPKVNNNNLINNSTRYNFNNANTQGTSNINANNNWWGISNESTIQDKIYDWLDNETIGMVNYSPYLAKPDTAAPVSPPNAVVKTNLGGGQIKLTWNHNPESDIKGYHVYYGGFNGYSFMNRLDVGNDTTYTLTGVVITDTIAVTAYDGIYKEANESAATIVNDNMVNGNESWYSYAAVSSQTGGSVTYNVTVPVGTNACYIVGDMNIWSFTSKMDKIDATHFTITLPSSPNFIYKYCCGPSWDYVEVNADGSDFVKDRTFAASDVVVKWKAVPTGINTIDADKLTLYPNPATDALSIKNFEGLATIFISDVSGRLLISKDITANESVSVSYLPNGIYLVGVKLNNIKKIEKLIIQRY